MVIFTQDGLSTLKKTVAFVGKVKSVIKHQEFIYTLESYISISKNKMLAFSQELLKLGGFFNVDRQCPEKQARIVRQAHPSSLQSTATGE